MPVGDRTVDVAGVLVADHISMSFNNLEVLHDVSLCFNPGAIHSLVGHNGSGKSTLIRILAGFHSPASGSVRIGGHLLPPGSTGAAAASGLRFVHQDLNLIPQFTALENFGIGAEYSRTRRRTIDWLEQRRRLLDALALLDETEIDLECPVSELRAVERTLVAIARAIASRIDGTVTKFLVLDEPTTALEEPETKHLFEVIRSLSRQGVGVLYVSHHLDEVLELSDEVSVLRDGYLIDTLPRSALNHAALVQRILGDEPGSVAGPAADGGRVARGTPEQALNGSSPAASALTISNLVSRRLRGVSFSIRPGECVCVAGLSGSGREELVYAITGAIPSVVDSVEVQGEAANALDPESSIAKRIALIPGNRQPGSIIDRFTIEENISLPGMSAIAGSAGLIKRGQETANCRTWIERLDIRPARPWQTCKELSGGNKQKVILAKWLSIEPTIMLIDEPMAGVDIGVVETIRSVLRQLADEGMAIMITTSELPEVMPIADRILVLRRGRLVREFDRATGWTESDITRAMMIT